MGFSCSWMRPEIIMFRKILRVKKVGKSFGKRKIENMKQLYSHIKIV